MNTRNRYIWVWVFILSLFTLFIVPIHAATWGVDSVSSAFFRDWYQTGDLGHYLDNCSPYVVYETETTGEWDLGDRKVFSISGNSFRQTKYRLNGMRLDMRTEPGNTWFYASMYHHSMSLDYMDGEISFFDDSIQSPSLRLTGNVGNLGGISPGTKALINLFHTSATERILDSRPVIMRNHTVGAGTADVTFAIPANGRRYYQHAYLYYGERRLVAFDHTGISGMYDAGCYTAQLDGELPLKVKGQALHYFFVTQGRGDYGSEFYLNRNEQAQQRTCHAGVYHTMDFANGGQLVSGMSYELHSLRHDSLSFARNLIDQDGEAFEPWYADGGLHSVNLSVQYDQPLLSWLRVHAEGYNSILHFRPATGTWTNAVYTLAYGENTPSSLYSYHWQSAPFTSGLLENEAMVIAQAEVAKGLQLYGHVGVSLDGVLLGNGRSVVSPNGLAKFALEYQPTWWFRFGMSASHHRMSYTWNEIRYLSHDYLNGEIRFFDHTLLSTTGGRYHTPSANLWAHQPSYAVVDIPVYFTFGRSRRHEIAVLNSYRCYYHQWFTTFADGVEANMTGINGVYYLREGEKHYTVGTQPLDLLSNRPGTQTPYYLSNLIRYTYHGKKWFVQLSWQSFMQSGFSSLGNGMLHNNLGVLSETTSYPNTLQVSSEGDKPYQANGRLNQDRAYIARLQVTYNACRYFSIGFNGKFKDGQAFATFQAVSETLNGHTQVAILPSDARGINPVNNAFGKREDAFFNFELRATGRWWAKDIPMSMEVLCYNLYDFGTALTEYTFDAYLPGKRRTMSLCIPRGLLFTLRIGLEKDEDRAHRP